MSHEHQNFLNSQQTNYRKTSNISRTLLSNKIVDNSDEVEASHVGAAPTTSSFSTSHLAPMDWARTIARRYKKHLSFGIWCDLYQRFYGISNSLFMPTSVKKIKFPHYWSFLRGIYLCIPLTKPGVGVTKALFVHFSTSKIFNLVKVQVRLSESH